MKKLILILLLLTSPAWATSVTVCDSGCDYTTIAAALTAVGSGTHTITVQTTYTAAERVTITQSGTDANNRLVIQGNTGQTITLQKFTIQGDYLTISNFTFDGCGINCQGGDGNIYFSQNATRSYITIQNCTFTDSTADNGIHYVPLTEPVNYLNYITIQNNLFSGQGEIPISVHADNMLIDGNTITDASSSGSDAMRIWGDTITVSNNTVYDYNEFGENHIDFIQTFANHFTTRNYAKFKNVVIEKNLVRDSTLQYCNFSMDGSSNMVGPVVWRNNVFKNIGYRGNTNLQNVSFYNNTFYNVASLQDGNGVINFIDLSTDYATGGIVENNLFVMSNSIGNGAPIIWDVNSTPTTRDYNMYTKLDWSTLANYSETNGVNGGNPNFTNVTLHDFTLSSDSPTNVGVNLAAFFTTDRAGTTRAVPWNIGAYEYSGGSPPSGDYPVLRLGTGAVLKLGTGAGFKIE